MSLAYKRNQHVRHKIAWYRHCAKYGWKCVYCGCSLTRDTVTKDHVVPKSKGGTNDLANLVPACLPCNQKKADRLLGVEIHATITRITT